MYSSSLSLYTQLQETDYGSDASILVLKTRLDSVLNQIKQCANAQFNTTSTSDEHTEHTNTSHIASASVASADGFVDLNEVENVTLSSEHLALIVDGVILTKILSSVTLRLLFLELACMCKAVLACRVSPEQKRLLVRLVKLKNQDNNQPTPVTLAIGMHAMHF
jgi:magnesium-transporting ATPase (P-type)